MKSGHSFRRHLSLFWVSCLGLFFEMLLIRWLSSEIRIFAYFHNLILLFCFFGIGLGCALADKKSYFMISFAVLSLLVSVLSLGPLLGLFSFQKISSYLSYGSNFVVWYNSAQGWAGTSLLSFLLGLGLLLFCMLCITLFFVPFGQRIGRLLNEHNRPLSGYFVNLLGSLFGILLFFGVSYFSLPPYLWFALGGIGLVPLLFERRWQALIGVALVFGCVFLLFKDYHSKNWTLWSPYQKLTIIPRAVEVNNRSVPDGYVIWVNSVRYMMITDYSAQFKQRYPILFPRDIVPYDHYNIAYRFMKEPGDVLILGAGAGNDTAGALRNGARSVDAVELDPKIIEIGERLHPEAPYKSPRVHVAVDDARSFIRKTSHRYDLVVLGLLDSHALSSSYSNVRLDNYVYTLESFREIKRLLKPNGVVVLVFAVADEFIGARFQQLLTQVFEHPPVEFQVHSGFRGWGGYGFVTGNEKVIKESLSRDPHLQSIVQGSQGFLHSWSSYKIDLTTDDWPYLYLRDKTIPNLYYFVFFLLALFSYIGIKKVTGKTYQNEWHFLFLGAGFLLLEVQSISKSALLFGGDLDCQCTGDWRHSHDVAFGELPL